MAAAFVAVSTPRTLVMALVILALAALVNEVRGLGLLTARPCSSS
jgi:hypothetical protein